MQLIDNKIHDKAFVYNILLQIIVNCNLQWGVDISENPIQRERSRGILLHSDSRHGE